VLSKQLADAGFDITAMLPWQSAVAIAPILQTLHTSNESHTHALLIGNTKRLWPRFVAAYQSNPQMRQSSDPFDGWIEQQLSGLLEQRKHFFGHRAYSGAYVPLQRLAVAAGIGKMSATHLVIHPVYGPWFSLRAIVEISDEEAAADSGLHLAVLDNAEVSACDAAHCTEHCQPRFEEAQLAPRGAWQPWIESRASCCVGAAWRYSPAQIAYHYGKNTDNIG
jgi:cyanocobalamin reductase (cyanide-eliminating) / alkylcobalamin dealkylase